MKTKRIMSFDGIKALAIFFVISYHLFPKIFPAGFLWVNTFYVLAGFFFIRKLEALKASKTALTIRLVGTYLLSVFKRLFGPMFWMIAFVCALLYLFNPNELLHIKNDVISGLTFTNNFFQIYADRSYFAQMAETDPFTHLWYNSIYLQAVVIGIGLFLLTNFNRLLTVIKAVPWLLMVFGGHLLPYFLYEAGSDPSALYYNVFYRFTSFAMGAAIAYLCPLIFNVFYHWSLKRMFYQISSLCVFLVMLVLTFRVNDQMPTTYYLFLPLFTFLSAFLILGVLSGAPLLNRLLSVKLLPALGKKSYAYYLWYFPVIAFVSRYIRSFNERIWLMNLIMVILIILLSELWYLVFERNYFKIPFIVSLNFHADSQALKDKIWQEGVIRQLSLKLGSLLVVFVLFLISVFQLDNQKRLAYFINEYRFFQATPNMAGEKKKEERAISQTVEALNPIDEHLQTNLAKQVEFEAQWDLSEESLKQLNRLAIDQVDEIVGEHQEIIQAYFERHEELLSRISAQGAYIGAELPITLFGDSIANMSSFYFKEVFEHGNTYGQGSLQIWDAIPIYQELLNEAYIQDYVVFILGTNAGLDEESLETLVDLSADKELFFVNTNSAVQHLKEVNQLLGALAQKHANVHVVDWYHHSQGRNDWFEPDDIHPNPDGIVELSALIINTIEANVEFN